MITLEKGIEQKGDIKVAAQIIQDLSSGIYSSTAVALKELINNSYDADAENVTIRMLPDIDTILITDNGSGMNAIDFDENFAWISKSLNFDRIYPKVDYLYNLLHNLILYFTISLYFLLFFYVTWRMNN